MKSSKNKFRVEIENVYVAGATASIHCKHLGLETSGHEFGRGWGATPKQAKRRALKNLSRVGNTDVECVAGEVKLYEDGVLIRHSY